MGCYPSSPGMQFACNGDICSPGHIATFDTYADMLSWANRAFDLGLSRKERAGAYCEVIARGQGVDERMPVGSPKTDWSGRFQYYVFSMQGAKASPVVLNFVANYGELL